MVGAADHFSLYFDCPPLSGGVGLGLMDGDLYDVNTNTGHSLPAYLNGGGMGTAQMPSEVAARSVSTMPGVEAVSCGASTSPVTMRLPRSSPTCCHVPPRFVERKTPNPCGPWLSNDA